MVLFFINSRLQESNQINIMNRKEFLTRTGALLPLSFLGMPKASASAAAAMPATPAEAYWASEAYQSTARSLKFNANGKFKIVQFTDVHWVPGNDASEVAGERMREVLDAEKPDLVIFTGDVAFGKPAKTCFQKAFEPVISRGIPFAFTFGNHDDEQGMTRQEIFQFIKDMPGNLTGHVVGLSGVTNYILPILSSDGSKEAFTLYHFDSHSYSPDKAVEGYDWIKADQVAWYRESSAKIKAANGGKPLPAMAFFHIPLPEYNEAARDEGALLIGVRKETACAPKVNSGLFTAMLEAGDVMGVFVGHDHVNDYVTSWKGILLGYGRYTGGKTVYWDVPWGNGARVIELTEGERSFETWVRLRNNRVEARVQFPVDFSKEPY